MQKILAFFLVGIALCYGQSLEGVVESVTTYPTCLESPLNQLPLSQGSASNNFTNPCEQYGNDNNVTAIRVNIRPNRSQATKLVFSLYHSTNASSSSVYSQKQNCSGTNNGANCFVLADPLILSFESTELWAVYQLIRKKYSIPYAYYVFVNQDVKLPNGGQTDFDTAAETIDCSALDYDASTAGVFQLEVNGQNGKSQSVCPQMFLNSQYSKLNQFYSPPGNSYVSQTTDPQTGNATPTDAQCTALLCRYLDDDQNSHYLGVLPREVEPLCTVFDILQRPTGLMNVKLNVTTSQGTQILVLSTTDGGDLQAVPGLLSAQITNINTGIGLIGRTISGYIITCNTCNDDNAGDINCELGLVDDTAGVTVPGDTFTITNPYTSQAGTQGIPGKKGYTDCNLPAAVCRENVGGTPANAWWYYVSSLTNYQYGLGCDMNGVKPTIYNQQTVRDYVCPIALEKATSSDSSLGAFAGACIPGFPQQGNALILGDNVVFTPCQVSQIWAQFLGQYTGVNTTDGTHSFSSGYFNMPPAFNPPSPNYFIKNSQLYTLALGGDSSEVSVDIIIYLQGEFVGQINLVSPGVFSSAGLACTSAQEDQGALSYSVKNTGSTAGQYQVVATAILPSGDTPQVFSFTAVGVPGTLSATQSIEVAAGQVGTNIFDYTYTGQAGSALNMQLELYIPSGSGNFVLLQKEVVKCTIAGPGRFIDNIQSNVAANNYVPPPQPCSWFDLTCWNNLGLEEWLIRGFILIMSLLILLTLNVFIIYAIVRECMYWNEERKIDSLTKNKEK